MASAFPSAAALISGIILQNHFFVAENQLIFGVAYGIGFSLTLIFAGRFIKIPEQNEKSPSPPLAIAGIAVMAAQLLAVEGMKYLWGRVRFRDLLAAGSYDAFTPLVHHKRDQRQQIVPERAYRRRGNEFSCHVAAPMSAKKHINTGNYAFICRFFYTCTVAVTRLIMGAHYLSDVAMGGAVGMLTVVIAMAVLDKKIFNHKKNSFIIRDDQIESLLLY